MNKKQLALFEIGDAIQDIDPIEANSIGFAPQFLIHASLPYKNPKPDQLEKGIWVRRNGNYALHVQGGTPGIPYGSYPRIFSIWLENEVILTKRSEINAGRSLNAFCERLRIAGNRSKNLFIDQVRRFLYSRYWMDRSYLQTEKGKSTSGRTRTHFIQPVRDIDETWSKTNNSNQHSQFEWTIQLDKEFTEELLEYYVPIDMRAIPALQSRPGALDAYQWLAYKNHVMKRPFQQIGWNSLFNQFGSANASNPHVFKTWFTKILYHVKAVYAPLRFEIDKDTGLLLRKSPTPVPSIRSYVSRK